MVMPYLPDTAGLAAVFRGAVRQWRASGSWHADRRYLVIDATTPDLITWLVALPRYARDSSAGQAFICMFYM